MPSPVEQAVTTYIRACCERDAATRAALLETCFAEDGRMVSRGREMRGRAAIAEMLDRAHANPDLVRIRLISAVDARGTTFRYSAVADRRDGTSPETFDAGEIDASGKISLILTFSGPLGGASEAPNP
jgi:hypothetical protein